MPGDPAVVGQQRGLDQPEPVLQRREHRHEVEQGAERGQPRERTGRSREGDPARPFGYERRRFAVAVRRNRPAVAVRGRGAVGRGRGERGRGGHVVGGQPALGRAGPEPRLRPHRREQDHLADRLRAGDQHHQPVEPDPEPAGRRQPVLERPDVVVVDVLGLLVAGRLGRRLGLEPRALVDRVVELRVGVGQLARGDDRLEALHEVGVGAVRARERRDLARVVVDEGRAGERALAGLVVDLGHQPAGAPAALVGDVQPVADRPRLLERHRGVHLHPVRAARSARPS